MDTHLPAALTDLEFLIGITSAAFPGCPPSPVHDMAVATVHVLRRAGAHTARLLDAPGGYPAVYANLPGPAGTPTVLLYAHYDIRAAGGDRTGIVLHAGTVRAFRGRPPVGVRILVEGEEPATCHLPTHLRELPRLVECDRVVLPDVCTDAEQLEGSITAQVRLLRLLAQNVQDNGDYA